jgi:RecA/RadA recombinase
MSDLYEAYPEFCLTTSNEEYEPLLIALESAGLTTMDLLVMEPKEISQRCGRSINEVKRFIDIFLEEVNSFSIVPATELTQFKCPESCVFTTGDTQIDAMFQGGIRTCCVTEVAGESAVGKSNFLTQLSATVQLPYQLGGLGRSAIYISTEGDFETRRLVEILEAIGQRYQLPLEERPTTDRIRCFTCRDQEELEHILKYQLPIAVEKFDVGLVVIDSIAAHYRAEFDSHRTSERTQSVIDLVVRLRRLASKFNFAVVTANQVSERFPRRLGIDYDGDPLFLDHQVRWFSGWSDRSLTWSQSSQATSSPPLSQPQHTLNRSVSPHPLPNQDGFPRVPCLGILWANWIDTRIVLKRWHDYDGAVCRYMQVVFSPFSPPGGLHFEISKEGVCARG